MTKKIIIAFFVPIGIIIIWILFANMQTDNQISCDSKDYNVSIKRSGKKSENLKVSFSSYSSQSSQMKQDKEEQDDKSRDKKIKYITQDNEGRYKILLKDENLKNMDVTIIDGYRRVIGTIDGHRFVLKVPLKSIDNGNLKLIIIDKHNNQKKELEVPFLSELSTLNSNQRYHIELYFDDITNVTTHIVETTHIFPGP